MVQQGQPVSFRLGQCQKPLVRARLALQMFLPGIEQVGQMERPPENADDTGLRLIPDGHCNGDGVLAGGLAGVGGGDARSGARRHSPLRCRF